jgi:uncharacterized protein
VTDVRTIVVRGVVTDVDGEWRLAGSRCGTCDTHAFPIQATCPRCGAAMFETALPATGTVWSCTVQRIRPKPPYEGPDEWEPFAVGYVDLGPVRVESRLEGKPVADWQIGEAVRLAAGEPGPDGEVWSFRFVPPAVTA